MTWKDDIQNPMLPENVDAFEKLRAVALRGGQRLGWWYQADQEFASKEGIDVSGDPPYGGVLIPVEGVDNTGGEYDPGDCLVVVDKYPVEKCYSEIFWVALNRLLDDPNLVRVVELTMDAKELNFSRACEVASLALDDLPTDSRDYLDRIWKAFGLGRAYGGTENQLRHEPEVAERPCPVCQATGNIGESGGACPACEGAKVLPLVTESDLEVRCNKSVVKRRA